MKTGGAKKGTQLSERVHERRCVPLNTPEGTAARAVERVDYINI